MQEIVRARFKPDPTLGTNAENFALAMIEMDCQVHVVGTLHGEAIHLLQKAKANRGCAGKDPKGTAAAILYIAAGEGSTPVYTPDGKRFWLTQKVLSEAVDITEVTIRNRYKDLKRVLVTEALKS